MIELADWGEFLVALGSCVTAGSLLVQALAGFPPDCGVRRFGRVALRVAWAPVRWARRLARLRVTTDDVGVTVTYRCPHSSELCDRYGCPDDPGWTGDRRPTGRRDRDLPPTRRPLGSPTLTDRAVAVLTELRESLDHDRRGYGPHEDAERLRADAERAFGPLLSRGPRDVRAPSVPRYHRRGGE